MIFGYCKKPISFLVAGKAMRTPIVGWFSKKLKCIAVERPQDLSKKGTGSITIENETHFRGVGTLFTKEIMVGDTIKLVGTKVNVLLLIIFRFLNK